jgi:hypothetical protein
MVDIHYHYIREQQKKKRDHPGIHEVSRSIGGYLNEAAPHVAIHRPSQQAGHRSNSALIMSHYKKDASERECWKLQTHNMIQFFRHCNAVKRPFSTLSISIVCSILFLDPSSPRVEI